MHRQIAVDDIIVSFENITNLLPQVKELKVIKVHNNLNFMSSEAKSSLLDKIVLSNFELDMFLPSSSKAKNSEEISEIVMNFKRINEIGINQMFNFQQKVKA